jgi:hypothetical protein
MANRFSNAAKQAKDITNKDLATEISAISNFSRDKINELLPSKKDKETFVKLMEQVEADTTMDEKLAYLQNNLKSAGVVALQLLKALT